MKARAKAWRGSIARAMREHHWRYAVYLPLMGFERFQPYRIWLWSRWRAYRGLNDKRREDSKRGVE